MAEIAQTDAPEWWERATPDDIGRTAALAEAWALHYPGGEEAKERLHQQLQDGYGVLLSETGTSTEIVAAQLHAWAQDRARKASEVGGSLTDHVEAEISVSEAAQGDSQLRSNVRFEPVPESGKSPNGTADVLAQLAKLPPQEELTQQDRELICRWAFHTPEVDAAIWRKYPDVFPDHPAVNRDAHQERNLAAAELAASRVLARDADELAAGARRHEHLIDDEPEQQRTGGFERLRPQAATFGADAEHACDSAERRASTADLEGQGIDAEAVQAHHVSDTAQGRPARDAVRAKRITQARPRRNASGREHGTEWSI